jgi:ATP-dependent NAD(P)H-hydrate dehydratase
VSLGSLLAANGVTPPATDYSDNTIAASRMPMLAAIGGSLVTRTASRRAFAREGRGLVTEDMLPEIGKSFAEVFGGRVQGQHTEKL